MYCSAYALASSFILKLACLETTVFKWDMQTGGASYKYTCLGNREQINHIILWYLYNHILLKNSTSAVWALEVNSLGFLRLWQSFLICVIFFTSNHTFMLCPDQESLRLGILASGREFFLFDIGQGSYSEEEKRIQVLGWFIFSLITSH